MTRYETPTLTEVGSVRELTQQTKISGTYDGHWYHGSFPGNGNPGGPGGNPGGGYGS